jgi:hypothetical protein
VLAAMLVAAPAWADSIVYIKDANVWLANPDGSGQYQVTLDGTADSPYSAPSQANDGALMAVKGRGTSAQFHHLRQNGDLIDPPFAHSAPTHPQDAQLSPDGRLIAYHWSFGNPKTFFSYSNRFTAGEEITNGVNFQNPAWMSNSRVFLSFGASATYTYDLGNQDATPWFADSATTVYDPDLDASNSRIVVIGNRDSGNPETLTFFATNGPPPAAPTRMPCFITNPVGGSFDDPTFAPDGTALAWAEGDGVWRATVGTYDSPDCAAAFTAGGLIIPGASEPDWGPTDVNPGPRSTPGAPGTGPGTPPPGSGFPAPAPGAVGADPLVESLALAGRRFTRRTGFRFRIGLARRATVLVRIETLGRARRGRAARVLGTVRFNGRAGRNTFTVKKARRRTLRPGRYRATITAVAGDTRSAPRRLTFVIRR